MTFRYVPNVLKATQNLISAVNQGNYLAAEEAISRGADVNCRIKKQGDCYRIASDDELHVCLRETKFPYINGGRTHTKRVLFTVSMADTTTLLNVLSRGFVKDKSDRLQLSRLLMENGAELGAIDYASYWEDWGKSASNYFQNTPLLNAIANEQLDFALLYMQFLLKIDERERKEILDYKDKFVAGFHTALEFAVRRGFSQLATQIVLAGANLNPQPFVFAYDGQSPLHMACMMLGQSWLRNRWHPHLGSDLELVLALIEHGADLNLTAATHIYEQIQPGQLHTGVEGLTIRPLAAFDHIDVSLQSISERPFNYIEACFSPAFFPRKVGQIRHPFHDDQPFRSHMAQNLFFLHLRENYLASEQFQTTDKIILQKAILKRIISDFLTTTKEDAVLQELDINGSEVQEIVDLLLSHPQNDFFHLQLQYGGIIYNAHKPANLLILPSDNSNPLLQPQLRNSVHCQSNDPAIILRQARAFSDSFDIASDDLTSYSSSAKLLPSQRAMSAAESSQMAAAISHFDAQHISAVVDNSCIEPAHFLETSVGSEVNNTSLSEAPPSENLTRSFLNEELCLRLERYINRTEQDYTKGFWFFKQSRTINREANCLLAKELKKELESPDNSIRDIFNNSHITAVRDTVIDQNGLFNKKGYVKRDINSNELCDIFKLAQKFI